MATPARMSRLTTVPPLRDAVLHRHAHGDVVVDADVREHAHRVVGNGQGAGDQRDRVPVERQVQRAGRAGVALVRGVDRVVQRPVHEDRLVPAGRIRVAEVVRRVGLDHRVGRAPAPVPKATNWPICGGIRVPRQHDAFAPSPRRSWHTTHTPYRPSSAADASVAYLLASFKVMAVVVPEPLTPTVPVVVAAVM